MDRIIQRSAEARLVRRVLAVLSVANGNGIVGAAREHRAARQSVQRWLRQYQQGGIDGLRLGRGGRPVRTVTPKVKETLTILAKGSPRALRFLRSTWTSELLALTVRILVGVRIHASTVRRLLRKLNFGWRRARPTLFIRDPQKAEKLAAITEALGWRGPDTAVLFADEADVNLNPKIGFMWAERGKQPAIPTPGKNQKRYLAGALDAHTGAITHVAGTSKASKLFVALLEALEKRYPRAPRIVLIVDNCIVHKSRETNRWLSKHPRVELRFQPVYHPWVNRIERLWKAMHDTVTRNHHYSTIEELMLAVEDFMEAAAPFPGAGHGLVTAAE